MKRWRVRILVVVSGLAVTGIGIGQLIIYDLGTVQTFQSLTGPVQPYLTDWKVQLPIGAEEDPDEVTQPELATYAVDPWFVATDTCDGVRFRAAVDGVTTGGSNYPRSELREMDGSDEAGWSAEIFPPPRRV